MEYMMKGFGKRLEQAIQNKNYNYSTLAKEIGVYPSAVSMWVNEERTPYAPTLLNICIALDVSADWLLGLEEKEYANE